MANLVNSNMYLLIQRQPVPITIVAKVMAHQRRRIMRITSKIAAVVAAALIITPLAGLAKGMGGGGNSQGPDRAQMERGQMDFDRDRIRDRDRIDEPAQDRDRVKDQDRAHAPDSAKLGENKIYGAELMSKKEREQYREQLRLVDADKKQRTQFLAQHQEKMQARAKEKGVKLDDMQEAEEAE
jgi:hypothetical protein